MALFGVWAALWAGLGVMMMGVRGSEECGPNPLTVVVAAGIDLGELEAVEVLAMLESDPDTWGEFLALVHAYDDCVRTSHLRYRRMASGILNRGDSSVLQQLMDKMEGKKSRWDHLSPVPRLLSHLVPRDNSRQSHKPLPHSDHQHLHLSGSSNQ